MNRTHAGLIASLAAVALLSLPPGAAAQPPAPQPPAAQTPAQPQPPVPQPQTGTPATPATPPTGTAGDNTQAVGEAVPSGALVLLGRIAELVDRTLGDKDALAADKATNADGAAAAAHATGTSGTIKVGKTGAGQVSVDRSTLDEIKAEVEQLKIMMSDRKP